MFTDTQKPHKKRRFISEEERGENVGFFMANLRLCSQESNDHLGSNFCLEGEGKFVVWLPRCYSTPRSFAVSSLNISCKRMTAAQTAVVALSRHHK